MIPRRPRFNKRRAARKPRRAARKPARVARRRPVRKMGSRRVVGLSNGVASSSSVMLPTQRKLLHAKVARQIAVVGASNQYIINTAGQLNALLNTQAFTTYGHISNFLMNQIRSQITTLNTPVRYVLESYQSVFTFTNTTNAPIEVDIYDICCKRQVLGESAYTTSLGTYPLNGFPDSYWVTGSLVQQDLPPGSTAGSWKVPGASPFDSQLFKEYFVVKKRTFVTLPLGATHRHAVLQKPNCLVTDAILKNIEFSGEPGLATWTMFVMRGYPGGSGVGGPSEPPVPPAGPLITDSQLNIMQATRVTYTWASDIADKTFVQNNLINGGPYKIMNVASGLPEPWAAA